MKITLAWLFAIASGASILACEPAPNAAPMVPVRATASASTESNPATRIVATIQSTPTGAPTQPIPATSLPTATVAPNLTRTRHLNPTELPDQLSLLVGTPPDSVPGYRRDDWHHWIDADGDCQNASHEVLIEESLTPVTFAAAGRCKVASGRWYGAFTGRTVTDAGDLDIDHFVLLANTHRSGGWRWPADQKRRYANDLIYGGHLIAVTSGANRSKGSRWPEDWRPSDRTYWCNYAIMWIEIKHLWALTATPSEVDALNEMLATSDAPLGLATVQPTPEFGSPLNPTAVPTMETSSLETIYCTETHCALPSGAPVNRIEAKCGAQYNCRPVGERPTPTRRPTIKPTLTPTRLPTPTPRTAATRVAQPQDHNFKNCAELRKTFPNGVVWALEEDMTGMERGSSRRIAGGWRR